MYYPPFHIIGILFCTPPPLGREVLYIIIGIPNYSERKSRYFIRLPSQSPSAYAVCRCK